MKHTTMIFRVMILFILALASSSYCKNSATAIFLSNVTDQEALLSFKDYITGDLNSVLSSWNHSIHFCQWEGVTCSRIHQRVTVLDLSSQQLDGSLSPHIGNLSFLRVINLQRNNFVGSIPGEIGKLFHLQYLHLGSNSFQGGFLVNLSQCRNIRNIIIEENNLGGRLPTEFTSWSNLDGFSARKNHFTGSIPSSIVNLSSLRTFDMGQNILTGGIPMEVAHLPKLENLILSENNLLGSVPLPLYNMSSLSYVALTRTGLDGRLPADMGFTLPNLQYFLASFNKFSGPFPLSITNASKLQELDLAYNNISGPLPMNLGSLPSLLRLNLGHNQLGHNQLPGGLSFLSSLVNSTWLKYLGLYENGLRGELPSSIVNMSTTLDQLDLFHNHIYGSIPREIGKLSNLIQLALSQNMLTGSIPESICRLSKLGRIYLIDNNISGVVPSCINNITGLVILSLGNNMLHGSIPAELGNISSLQGFSLKNNHLSGVIPVQIMGLSSLTSLRLGGNLLTGPLPSNIGSLIHLVDLRLSGNRLTGEIPSSLGYCVMLESLSMEGNLFEGRIPSTFKALKSLISSDLSNNNLAGEIPHFLAELHLMQFLNLSHNKLEGEVPTKGLFSNVSAFSVDGNSEICGGIPALKLPTCHVNISGSKKKQFRLRILPLIVLLPLGTLLACFYIVFYRIKKSKQKNARTQVLQDNQHPRLSYQDLLLATTDFSANSLLGKGRYGVVYKGILESLHQIVAVKVINVEVHGANKTFLAECETLRNIRHRNLIKIITACSSTDYKGNDFKALVFEFMANGSLDTWLHRSPSDQENERNLTLFQRLNIAIDVALALDYLHHQCHTKIIHCDIKPSNILLDEDFVARVTDFGLARFFPTSAGDINQAQTSSTCVRGTVGYVPPEYGMGGEISAKGDVYSYGILLLEMFSGKIPTGDTILMDCANNLHEYVRKALPQRVMKIADPRIIQEQGNFGFMGNESVGQKMISNRIEVCLASIFEVGVLCSSETPRERIDIYVAIKKLQAARDKLLQQG